MRFYRNGQAMDGWMGGWQEERWRHDMSVSQLAKKASWRLKSFWEVPFSVMFVFSLNHHMYNDSIPLLRSKTLSMRCAGNTGILCSFFGLSELSSFKTSLRRVGDFGHGVGDGTPSFMSSCGQGSNFGRLVARPRRRYLDINTTLVGHTEESSSLGSITSVMLGSWAANCSFRGMEKLRLSNLRPRQHG